MEEKILGELQKLAKKIEKLDASTDVSKLQKQARKLYERLTVLRYTSECISAEKEKRPTKKEQTVKKIDKKEEPVALEDHIQQTTEVVFEPVDEVTEEEPKIKAADDFFESILPEPEFVKNDMVDVTPDVFEEKAVADQSVANGKAIRTIAIGLNDKIGFISHLFGGSDADYNRVISQLNTFQNEQDAKSFINQMVKPDYNNWEGKEQYEDRLIQLIESKFS